VQCLEYSTRSTKTQHDVRRARPAAKRLEFFKYSQKRTFATFRERPSAAGQSWCPKSGVIVALDPDGTPEN